ncbi:MAG: hypothetical protein K2X81_23965 [Candidatus Obscuribacterales bacterium]|nr:hypothetical protein [Candidatus Obscuribacterales bacterium]
MKKLLSITFALLSLFASATVPTQAAPNKEILPPSGRQFTREEYMVLNLNRGADSTGAHISESLKQVKFIVKDLDKGLRQLQQIDKEYAKSKGRPDDKFLGNATDRLQQALRSAQQLSADLEASRDELKDNIHQALIMAP